MTLNQPFSNLYSNGEVIVDVTSATSYRSHKKSTKPQVLDKDKCYFLEVRHLESTGRDHLTVGFTLEADSSVTVNTNHPNSQREIQEMVLDQE